MYDSPVAVPIIDVLDSNMMTQYITAAKEQYAEGLKEQEKFAKEFGDLYSPSAQLNEAYYNATRGAVNDAMDYLQERGIDPVRSQEGRAYMQKVIRERPYSDIAKWKAQAENMNAYKKAAASMLANGKLTQDQLDYQMQKQGLDFSAYNPYTDNWTAVSPTEMQSLAELTKTPYAALKPSALTKDQVIAEGLAYDPRYQYSGITSDAIKQTAGVSVPAVLSSAYGDYYYDKAKQELQAAGIKEPTDSQIREQLQNTVAGIWAGKKAIDWEPDKYAALEYQNKLAQQLDTVKSQNDAIYDTSRSARSGGKGKRTKQTVFDIARSQPGTPVPHSFRNISSLGVFLASDGAKIKLADKSGDDVIQISKFKNTPALYPAGTFAYAKKTGGAPKTMRFYSNDGDPTNRPTIDRTIFAKIIKGVTYNKDTGKYYIKIRTVPTPPSRQSSETLEQYEARRNHQANIAGKEYWMEVVKGYTKSK